jgi:hypothetical protein
MDGLRLRFDGHGLLADLRSVGSTGAVDGETQTLADWRSQDLQSVGAGKHQRIFKRDHY